MLGPQNSASFHLHNSPVRQAGKPCPHFIFKGTEASTGCVTGPGLRVGCGQSSCSGLWTLNPHAPLAHAASLTTDSALACLRHPALLPQRHGFLSLLGPTTGLPSSWSGQGPQGGAPSPYLRGAALRRGRPRPWGVLHPASGPGHCWLSLLGTCDRKDGMDSRSSTLLFPSS